MGEACTKEESYTGYSEVNMAISSSEFGQIQAKGQYSNKKAKQEGSLNQNCELFPSDINKNSKVKFSATKKMPISELNSEQRSSHVQVKVENFKYKDGSTYSGEMLDNKRHGQGKQIWKDGSQYEGNCYF